MNPTSSNPTLNPQAQQGLDYLKTANPDLASSIGKYFNPAPSNTPISADALTGTSSLNIPTYTPPISPGITAPPPPDFGVGAARDALNGNLNDISGVETQLGQKSAVNNQLTDQYVTPLNKDLAELYAKDSQYQASLSNISSQSLQATNTSEDRLAPMFAINGEQAQLARQAQNASQSINIQRATNAALISAKQGQVSLAQDYVNRALSAEFDPLQSKLDYLKTVLSVNQDTLSKSEQSQLQAQIDQYQNQLQQGQQNKQDIYSILVNAASAGAPNTVLDAIANAPTRDQAAQYAGIYTNPDNVILQTDSYGNVTAINKANGTIQWQQKGVGPTNSTLLMGSLYSPDLINGVSSGLIDPSKVNSRTAPFYAALAKTGTDAVGATANAATYTKVSEDLGLQAATIDQAKNALDQNLNFLATLSDKVNTAGVPKYDNITNNILGQYSNQPDIVKYLNVLNTVRSEYAKYLARGSSAGVTDGIRNEANQAIPAGVNGDTLRSLLSALDTEGQNVQSSIQYARQQSNTDRLNGAGTAQTTAADPLGIF